MGILQMNEIYSFDNVFYDRNCDYIIDNFGYGFKPSKVAGKNIVGYRVAEDVWIQQVNDPIIFAWESIVEYFTNVPRSNFEWPHLVKYEEGCEYKEHHDYFHKGTKYYYQSMKIAGQRTHTAILYLNDDFTGGETFFKMRDLTVKPKKGSICVWRNTDKAGFLLQSTLHAGLPVTSGIKYILVSWVRELPFR